MEDSNIKSIKLKLIMLQGVSVVISAVTFFFIAIVCSIFISGINGTTEDNYVIMYWHNYIFIILIPLITAIIVGTSIFKKKKSQYRDFIKQDAQNKIDEKVKRKNEAIEKEERLLRELDDNLEKYKVLDLNELHHIIWEENKDYILNEGELLLRSGEHLYYCTHTVVSYHEKEAVVGYANKRDGFNVKVTDGVYYHTGGSRGESIKNVIKETQPGVFYLTNKRVILKARKWGFELPIDKVSNVEYQEQAIVFYKSGKPYIVGFPLGAVIDGKEIRNLLYLITHGADQDLYQEKSFYEKEETIDNKASYEFYFFKGCDSEESIKARYRRLMTAYHPDTGIGDEDTTKEINRQYEELMRQHNFK